MKKLFALLLVVVMVLSLAACKQPVTPSDPTGTQGTTPSGTTPSIPSAPATYTYNTTSSTFPNIWNPHTYKDANNATVLDYITDGFYTFDYNEDMTGFQMVPAMVVDDHPIDITSDYVGKFGIEEGDSKLVWKIVLRDDLCWDNGDKITAHDFVESAQLLLNPAAQNYRADSLYTGDVVIVGALEYLKQGQSNNFAADSIHTVYSEDLDAELIFTLAPGDNQASFRGAFGFPASYDAAKTATYLATNYLAGSAFTVEVAASMEGKTLAEIKADATMKAAWDALIGWWQTEPNEELDFFLAPYTYPEKSWDDVGIFALSDTELVYVIESPLDGFYLKYGMPSGYLVHAETYKACESIDPETGVYTNSYYTNETNSPSYGPYKLTTYQTDKEMVYEKNDKWYGHGEGVYQTTHIHIQYVENDDTKLNLLLEGKTDVYGLTANDFEKYGMSDYTYYAEGASTFAMVFNPNLEALEIAQKNAGENKNKTIITLLEFRQAMSFGMNRPAFTAATDPAGINAYGIFSSQHIVDPETGVGYRTTEYAKDVLVEFWGLSDEIGEGKLYADKDEAIASLTGYNPEQAKALFDAAYDKAIAQGLMDEDDVVEILIGLPRADSTFYNNGYNFIVNNYTELVKGTKLEGKLTFTRDDTLGNAFGDILRANGVDMLFGVGWSGMELNPYGLIMAYMTQQYQYDAAVDYTTVDLTINLNGVDYTTTVHNWYEIINGVEHTVTAADGSTMALECGPTAGDLDTRILILSRIEMAVLMNYNFIPLNGDASAQLKGQQIQYYTEEYIYGMGFGGIKYMTYNYTDAEWDAYVTAQGGQLDYT